MIKHPQTLAFVTVFALAFAAHGRAQEPGAAQPAKAATPTQPPQPLASANSRRPEPVLTPLKLQIVISRYQGEKKISSLPYTLSVNANDGGNRAVLRIGAQVPLPVVAAPTGDATKAAAAPMSYTYRDLGTGIDCTASTLEDGRFKVTVNVDDSSVFADSQSALGTPRLNDIPTLRTFRVSNVLLLRDGQSSQYTTASDKVSGEVVKIDVTLTVVK